MEASQNAGELLRLLAIRRDNKHGNPRELEGLRIISSDNIKQA